MSSRSSVSMDSSVEDTEEAIQAMASSQAIGSNQVKSLSDTMEDWSVQDTDERRKIRKKYHEMIQDMQQVDEHSIKNLKEKLNEAGELFTKVRLPREAALDSKLLRQLSTAALRKAETLDTNMVSFDPIDFVSRFATFARNDDEVLSSQDWEAIGKKMVPLFKLSPSFTFMFGSFPRAPPPPPVKKQKQRVTKELDEKGTVAVPQKIKEMGKSEHELTTEEVERVLKILYSLYERNGRNAICFFEFVCHPTSFTQTIQNIFHVSFLVKDGYAAVYLDDDELPVIEPIQQNQDQSSGNTQEQIERKEFVLSISQPEWAQVVEVFQIKFPLIPTEATGSL